MFIQLGSQEFSSKEVLPICATPLGAAATVRAHGTARSMRDKAEETMSRERSHAAFVVLSCAAVLLTLLGVVGISRSVLASSVGPAAARGSAALGDDPARLGGARAAHARRCADVRIVGAGIVPRAASEDGEWWLGYPLGEQVDDVPTHYSHIMRNFVPSVLRCTAVNGPGACYDVHLPLARLRELGAGKDALIEAVTTEVASLVNNATVTFVDSGQVAVSGPAGKEKFVARRRRRTTTPARAAPWASAARVPAGPNPRRRRRRRPVSHRPVTHRPVTHRPGYARRTTPPRRPSTRRSVASRPPTPSTGASAAPTRPRWSTSFAATSTPSRGR